MEKLVNIANDLQVIVSEFNGTLMLELRGAFKPQRISSSKIEFILTHAAKLSALVNDAETKEDLYQLGTDASVYMSSFQGTAMYELRGQFRPANISINKIKAVLKYAKELRQVLQENTSASVKQEQVNKATKELTVNAATIGTDKKSAKDTKTVAATIVTEKKQESLTIVEYLMRELNLTAAESMQYKTDVDAVAMYNKYVQSLSPVIVKALTFKERMAQDGISVDSKLGKAPLDNSSATEKTKAQTVKAKKDAKKAITSIDKMLAESPKSRGIPVSFSVQIKGNETSVIEDNKTRAMNNLVDKVLERVTLKKDAVTGIASRITEQKRITSVNRDTSSPSHYFDELVRQRYIFNVKELQ